MSYLILVLLLSANLFSLITFRYHPIFHPLSLVVFALSYFLWGLIHHALNHTLHRQVVLEYFSLSLLGTIIISILL